jgi:YbgC/YbaW family acyl-CoA thioester hydrolase
MPPEARAATDPTGRPRSIRRRLHLTPAFHQVDMMKVVHNVQFFYWFEMGRTQLMEEFMTLDASMKLGVAMPVVENQCLYRRPVRYGDPLLLITEHRRLSAWAGRLTFSHSLVLATGRLVKEWPDDLWQRYQALADGNRTLSRSASE